ncbi:MAG: hypothetical protein KDI51_13960 [Xanthomonadales bacterium]|nr:hypothetical protein [Xanthomonadales bacterium]
MPALRCPSCQFPIHNRRLAQCEFCQAELPAELIYSVEEIAALNTQLSDSLELAKQQMRPRRRDPGGEGGDGFGYSDVGSGDCGGDGGCD